MHPLIEATSVMEVGASRQMGQVKSVSVATASTGVLALVVEMGSFVGGFKSMLSINFERTNDEHKYKSENMNEGWPRCTFALSWTIQDREPREKQDHTGNLANKRIAVCTLCEVQRKSWLLRTLGRPTLMSPPFLCHPQGDFTPQLLIDFLAISFLISLYRRY